MIMIKMMRSRWSARIGKKLSSSKTLIRSLMMIMMIRLGSVMVMIVIIRMCSVKMMTKYF